MLTLSTGINSTVSYAKSAKSCPYFSLFFPNLPFHRENSGKWAHLSHCHAKFSLPSRPQTHHEICRRKEQIVLQKVLSKSAMPRPARMKQPLYNQEWMLHLAANRGFRVLDLPFPIRSLRTVEIRAGFLIIIAFFYLRMLVDYLSKLC